MYGLSIYDLYHNDHFRGYGTFDTVEEARTEADRIISVCRPGMVRIEVLAL